MNQTLQLPPPEGPEYRPCACGHIEPEHDINGRWCAMDDCPCHLYRPDAATSAVVSPPPSRAALRDRIRHAVCEADGFGFAWDTDMLEPDEYGEVADAVLAVLPEPADRAAVPVCICGHPEQRHFEDVCQTCGCGDYLEPRDAAEVIARWRQTALAARDELRRLAVEARFGAQQETTGHSCGSCEGIDPDSCLMNPDRAGAQQQPDTEARTEEQLVRAHVTTLHLIGNQLAEIEGWMWQRLADVREAATQAAPVARQPWHRTAGFDQHDDYRDDAPAPAAQQPAADGREETVEARCTCADAGDCFAPAGHYADCPLADATPRP
ncbi:hypothetical protein HZZ00_10985 [Streptomyces sp. NEAU-sy36]|uniref:hypothetical protein n=1 Tax=unclassified Streptomyces TaxID=2593676 RepID=UPI0015D5C3FB|nr:MULTISPECIES: hypothetical protein [unclassified Streptomyces]QLJ01495.1 hypothetical protein HZZ00_10985 [Streptomyces sp. NEAU-sy36]